MAFPPIMQDQLISFQIDNYFLVKQEMRTLQAVIYGKFSALNREIFSLIFEGQKGWKQGQFTNKMWLVLQVGLIAVNIIGDPLEMPSYSQDYDAVSDISLWWSVSFF